MDLHGWWEKTERTQRKPTWIHRERSELHTGGNWTQDWTSMEIWDGNAPYWHTTVERILQLQNLVHLNVKRHERLQKTFFFLPVVVHFYFAPSSPSSSKVLASLMVPTFGCHKKLLWERKPSFVQHAVELLPDPRMDNLRRGCCFICL